MTPAPSPGLDPHPGPQPGPGLSASSRLSLRGLQVPGRLGPCDLEIRAGEFVGLIGPNGAGKTTLLRAAQGMIAAGGSSSLTAVPVAARPRLAAYLAQERELVWPVTALDLVALGWRAHPDHRGEGLDEARALLEHLGLAGFASRQITGLSGGEKARILLARALAQGAPLLIADEPCAALDPAQAIRTARLLAGEARAGHAVLATLHDLPLAASHCTRIIVLHQGRIRADGPPAEVLVPDLLAGVFGIEMEYRPGAKGAAWAVTGLKENEDA